MRNVKNNLQEMTYLNKRSIIEPVAVLLPIKKDSLASKLNMSKPLQPLTSRNAKNPSSATSLPTETMDSNLKKTTVIESKENEIAEQVTVQKGDVQNSHIFTEDIKSIV